MRRFVLRRMNPNKKLTFHTVMMNSNRTVLNSLVRVRSVDDPVAAPRLRQREAACAHDEASSSASVVLVSERARSMEDRVARSQQEAFMQSVGLIRSLAVVSALSLM